MANDNDKKTFDVRFYLKDEFAKAARQDAYFPFTEDAINGVSDHFVADNPEIVALYKVLAKHGVSLHNQLDEFVDYCVKYAQVEDWETAYPDENERKFHQQLLAMTQATLANPEKCEYLAREFTIERAGGNPDFLGAFSGDEADAIIADLQAIFNSGVYGEGPRPTEQGVRKVYAPKRHPGTTVAHPSAPKQ